MGAFIVLNNPTPRKTIKGFPVKQPISRQTNSRQLARHWHVAISVNRLSRAVGQERLACLCHAVAKRLCVFTIPPMPGQARYNTKCVGVSELGFNLPSTTLPSASEITAMCCGFISA